MPGAATDNGGKLTTGQTGGSAELEGPVPAPVREPDEREAAPAPVRPARRIRATVLLVLNFLLFCGLCIFTHWLHVAQVFDFRLASYLEPLRFWGPQTQNLYDFILFPISVDQTPIHGVVIGLLVASIVAVPISVSILYRFRSTLPYLAAVLVLAHLPWMAITLAASCALASLRPFRMSFRFGSALLGMLPVLLYLYLATRGPGEPVSASISPERKLLLAGPWLLAILAACTMLAVIIFIARVVNDRPGAVAPVMAFMFATPAVLFHARVGADELQYRILEARYGPRSERFEPVRDATDKILALFHQWTMPGMDSLVRRSALLAAWSSDPKEQLAVKRLISRRLLLDLMDDRREAYEACKDFIADHPTSRYVPNVLYIQARVLDTRLDERTLVGQTAQRELYTAFPHAESEPVWSNLLTQYPHSPLAVVARLRVAQLRLRKGDADGALALLAAPPGAVSGGPQAQASPTDRPLLRPRPPESSLEFDPDQDLFEAERLRELIMANRDDPRYGTKPLRELAALDPHRPGYRDQLLRLMDRYPDGLLTDNLAVRWASAAPSQAERAEKLLGCIQRYPSGDALPEALFALADLEVQVLGSDDQARRAAGLARLRDIVSRFGHTCWGRRADERLKMLEPTATATLPTTLP